MTTAASVDLDDIISALQGCTIKETWDTQFHPVDYNQILAMLVDTELLTDVEVDMVTQTQFINYALSQCSTSTLILFCLKARYLACQNVGPMSNFYDACADNATARAQEFIKSMSSYDLQRLGLLAISNMPHDVAEGDSDKWSLIKELLIYVDWPAHAKDLAITLAASDFHERNDHTSLNAVRGLLALTAS
jgi:hypothetical protein